MSGKIAFVRARMPAELKESAEDILEKLGLSSGNAISAFYRQVQIHKGLPFELKLDDSVLETELEKGDSEENYTKVKSKKHLKSFTSNPPSHAR